MKEEAPMKSEELATVIRRVLDEREFLRNALGVTKQPKQEN